MLNENIERFIVWPRQCGIAIIEAEHDWPNPLKNRHFRNQKATTIGFGGGTSQSQSQPEQPQQQRA